MRVRGQLATLVLGALSACSCGNATGASDAATFAIDASSASAPDSGAEHRPDAAGPVDAAAIQPDAALLQDAGSQCLNEWCNE